jgi:hypothetical protein
MRRAKTDVMTPAHLRVCGTCTSWCIGHANTYCDTKVPEAARDEFGVMDWELDHTAIRGPHDSCVAWECWQ